FVDKALEALVPFNRARKMSPDELAADLAVGWRGVFEDVFKTEGGRDLGLRLVMSRGAALTHELRHFLECSMSPEDGDFSHIFVQAFRKLQIILVPGYENAGDIVFNGKWYEKVKVLGLEDKCELVRYRNAADPSDTII